MSSNWSSEEDEVLINFVRQHEAIYNTKHKEHRKTELKQNWWCEIGEILNKTESECSKRWCYIRDYYVRQRGKPVTGGEAARKRADLLSFIDNFPSTQRTGISQTSDQSPGHNFAKTDTENSQLTQNPKEETVEYNVEIKFNPQELNNLICKNDDTNKDGLASARSNSIFLLDKMSSKWSNEDDEILIDFIRKHEPIYNVKHKDYRKSELKLNWWREIGEILNKTDSDCSKRWYYIRDYYIRRRGKPGSSGEAARKRADLLSFLDTFPSYQRTIMSHISDQSPGDHFVMMDTESSELTENSEEEFIEYNVETKFNPLELNNKKLKISEHDQDIADQNCLDETDFFFSSMAKIVKKLPRYEQAKLRIQIGNLVGNAELRNLSKNSP